MGIEPRFHEVETDGPIIIWKFSNPPRNLATLETGAELVQLVEEFDRNPELRVGIVTSGVPGMFIQHFDVSSILGWAETLNKASDDMIQECFLQLWTTLMDPDDTVSVPAWRDVLADRAFQPGSNPQYRAAAKARLLKAEQ